MEKGLVTKSSAPFVRPSISSDLLVLGGQKDHRDRRGRGVGPDLREDLVPVEARHHDVEHHEIGPELGDRAERRLPVVDDLGLVPGFPEVVSEEFGQIGFIVNDQHSPGHGSCSCCTGVDSDGRAKRIRRVADGVRVPGKPSVAGRNTLLWWISGRFIGLSGRFQGQIWEC
jgi:hypothetical protein